LEQVDYRVVQVSEQAGAATIGEGSVRHWVMSALLEEGFLPEATVEISSRSTCRPINWYSDTIWNH